jgi:hypothetical protein
VVITDPENTAVGDQALINNTGSANTATGFQSLKNNTDGFNNTANGDQALSSNTRGAFNTANGKQALSSNTTGAFNTATGSRSLKNNTTGFNNTANGDLALFSNTAGLENTGNGIDALRLNTTGNDNTANGVYALENNTTGNLNTAIGGAALRNNTTGSNNVGVGVLAGTSVSTASNVICIGANVAGANVSNSCFIGSIFGQTSTGGTAVFINANGQLGTTTSSARFKEGIKPMNNASESLFSLKPVTFHYKKEIDPTSTSQFGLVAEEVEKANPDLVVRDKEGKPYTVRYEAVNAMLLNEFLKEHRKNEEQQATITRLQHQVEALTAGLQKVSAQLELSKAAPQTVKNND